MENRTIIILIFAGIFYLVVTAVVDFSTIFGDEEEEPIVLGVGSSQISNYYIYMFDLSTRKLTTVASNKKGLFNPAIYDNTVVYTSYEEDNGDIFVYDILSGETEQLTSDPYNQDMARIYEDIVVWDDSRIGRETDSRALNKQDVYMFNLSSGIELPLIKTRLPDRYPDIYGDTVVSEIYIQGAYGNVYVGYLSPPTLKEITSDHVGNERPRIYANKVVYYAVKTYDIYVYDLSTKETVRVTDTSEHEDYHNIYENRIVFQRILSEDNTDIYVYDLNTREEICITDTSGFRETSPDIHGSTVVFIRMYSPDKMDILAYDLDEGREIIIGSPSDFNQYPEIYGNKVVWSAFDVSV